MAVGDSCSCCAHLRVSVARNARSTAEESSRSAEISWGALQASFWSDLSPGRSSCCAMAYNSSFAAFLCPSPCMELLHASSNDKHEVTLLPFAQLVRAQHQLPLRSWNLLNAAVPHGLPLAQKFGRSRTHRSTTLRQKTYSSHLTAISLPLHQHLRHCWHLLVSRGALPARRAAPRGGGSLVGAAWLQRR